MAGKEKGLNYLNVSGKDYVSYIPDDVVFGMANAYLGLKAGMTVSATIPAAVISTGNFERIF